MKKITKKDKLKKTASLETITKIIVKSNIAIDSNFVIVNKKIEDLHNKINELGKTSSSAFGKVGKQLSKIEKEVGKIQKVSNYSDMYDNLMKVAK